MKKNKIKKSYWYLFHYEECPDCGVVDQWKERIYDKPKPEAIIDRYVYGYMRCDCIY
jgi:hypothetical protein